MPGKRPPLFADYLHFVKAGKEYQLAFQTRLGAKEVAQTFTGLQVDKIRAQERKSRKKLTVDQWLAFFKEL